MRANKVELAEEVNRLKQRFVARHLLPIGLPDPIVEVQLKVVDTGARLGEVRQEVDYAIRNQYPGFVFEDLVKDTTSMSSNGLWDMPLLAHTHRSLHSPYIPYNDL